MWTQLVLQPTNFKQNPTSPDRQLALAMYRLADGVTYPVLEDVFGISKESACIFFNKVVSLIVANIYDDYAKLSSTDDLGIFSSDTCHILILQFENIDPCC